MEKVVVGMSGGVDSAVCAYLLKQAGYDVVGVTLRTWESDGAESRCCEIDDARNAAERIGIPFHTLNCVSEFREKIVEPFAADYLRGLTPNPCVVCNRTVKWERLLYFAKVVGADRVATGHYASVVRLAGGRYTVRRALHPEKDQSYMLYRLTQEQLAATLMPLGGLSKDEVREIARTAGLPVSAKPDSQDVCFAPSGDYAGFVRETCPGRSAEGDFVDGAGNVLGRHRGIEHYTVGQRRGLGLPLGYPAYVRAIRADRNEVVVGDEASLYGRLVRCRDVNFMSIDGLQSGGSLPCTVKIRYRHDGRPARIGLLENDRVLVAFDEPVRAAAPGQSAVFYDGEGQIIGGGVIEAGE